MIRCNLSRLMGERKLKISDVERATELHRHKISALYKETAVKIDLDTIDKLCEYFRCDVGDLFVRVSRE